MKNNLIKAVIIIVIFIIAGILLYRANKKNIAPENRAEQEKPVTLGGQIFEQVQNPIKDKIPESNPFAETETNPLNNIYKNPFE